MAFRSRGVGFVTLRDFGRRKGEWLALREDEGKMRVEGMLKGQAPSGRGGVVSAESRGKV